MNVPRFLALTLVGPVLLFAGCRNSGTSAKASSLPELSVDLAWPHAGGDLSDPELERIAAEFWDFSLRADPLWATYLGDPRLHGELEDLRPASFAAAKSALERFRHRLRSIEHGRLPQRDRVTFALLEGLINTRIENHETGIEEWSWSLNPRGGETSSYLSIALDQPTETRLQREQLLQRWRKMGPNLRQAASNLRRGKRAGKVASESAVRQVLEQTDRILATRVEESPLLEPALGGGRFVEVNSDASFTRLADQWLGDSRRGSVLKALNRHLSEAGASAGDFLLLPDSEDDLDPVERGMFVAAVSKTVREGIYPGFERYRKVLADDILPSARLDAYPGIGHLPGGPEAYRVAIHEHTSLELTPEAIHEIGLTEVARIRAEIAELGKRVFGTDDVAQIQRHLRENPALHFENGDEIVAKAAAALEAAAGVMDSAFGLQPQAACEIAIIPAHEAPYTTVAYYRGPAPDGSRPGRYYVNTFEPKTRTRYEAEVLAYHESIPGHHLQISIAQQLKGLPLFQRHLGSTAFVEGWALYTERLCDELGLYTGDSDRLGMLSYDAWRACRLVVDTGLHAMNWSREQAIEYMLENTLLAPNNVHNEVDRYIAWPGQALAYKLGQLEILSLRAEAREALGEKYSDADFHDRVLENGAVTLTVLREELERWIASERP